MKEKKVYNANETNVSLADLQIFKNKNGDIVTRTIVTLKERIVKLEEVV